MESHNMDAVRWKMEGRMKKEDNKAKGRLGEDLAVEFLKEKGYTILQRNFRSKSGEVDIVALKGRGSGSQVLVFVEVKYRTSIDFGLPCQAVDYKKQRVIKQVAETYIAREKAYNMPCSLDIVEVYRDNGKTHINHLENCF